ncbi:MAG: ATP-binding protein [Rhodobacteraceae bacterium]|nr:ATP-binding protein [Paracoccaceae bacterium]
MNARSETPILDPRALDAEWARIAMLVSLVETERAGAEPPDGFAERFAECGEGVAANRAAGVWAGLAGAVAPELLESFVHLDLDLLAAALAPEARPALGARIHALQPQLGGPWPCLAVLEELLMLADGADVAALYDRLAPTAPLVAAGLVRMSGEGPYQQVRSTALAQSAALGRVTNLTPPPGAVLETRRARWRDLVLPERTLAALRDFVAWLRFRDQIIAWGGRPAGGPLALLTGASGTGKSLAAMVIAAELSEVTGAPWALYTLDLGRVMSKYVGETEENLNRLLEALDGRRAILQIDEADGLFGKRGEVTDARDRYANLEVSHMLSRFERHAGPVILTTNLRANIDAAFLRRFQMVIDFPSPDSTARAALWSALIPPGAPRDPALDMAELASAARLSGGAILNAAHYAAILAREAGEPVAHRHLARAVWAELGKENRQIRRSEVGSLAAHLEEEA